jgi:hypothetical protein
MTCQHCLDGTMHTDHIEPSAAKTNAERLLKAFYNLKRELQVQGDALALESLSLIQWSAVEAERKMVHRLRATGTTWEAIGTALGISKQAAQQKFRLG